MSRPIEDLQAMATEEISSEPAALAALDLAESLAPPPGVDAIQPYLPEKGTTVGLHTLLARSLEADGRDEEASTIFLSVAERLNQAGHWGALARVVTQILSRNPHQAGPLIARARAQGGAAAVSDDLLETAQKNLPGHGLLAWLAAEARMARGEVAAARRLAARALPELIAEKNYDTADMALLLLAEDEAHDTLLAMCRSLELLAKNEGWEQFDAVLDLAADLFASPQYASQAWPVLKELWGRHPERESLRPVAIRVAREYVKRYPEPEAMIRISEIERSSQSAEVILDRVEKAEAFPPGYYARHMGWGIGLIRDNDTESVVIDFPDKPGHRMMMKTAAQALMTLAPDDLQVLLVHAPEEVARLRKEEPVTLLIKALGCLKEPKGTGDEIRKILVPAVMPSASWTSWWKNTKVAADQDPRLDSREAYNNIFSMATQGAEGDEIVLPRWEPRRGVMKNLGVLDTFLEQHAEEAPRLLDAMRETVESVYQNRKKPTEAVAAGLWLLRALPEDIDGPEHLINDRFDFNALPKRDQEQLLDRLAAPPALTAALNSRLIGIRRAAWERIVTSGVTSEVLDSVLSRSARLPEAALHCLEGLDAAPTAENQPESGTVLLALLDLLESPPKESHRKRALEMIAAESMTARLQASPIAEDQSSVIAGRLRRWNSSDRFRFPVLDLLRAAGHVSIVEEVEGARARSAARLSDRMDFATDDPYDGLMLLTKPTLERLRGEHQRIGMELKTTIPKTIQKARELGDLKENAEYHAAKEKQASYAKRFEEIETLLNGVRLIESLERESGVVAPGTEVELEGPDGKTIVYWLLGEGDQEVGSGVVSYLATVGQAILGKRVGDEVTLSQDQIEATFRIHRVTERLP